MINPLNLDLDDTFEDLLQFLDECFMPANIKLSLRPHGVVLLHQQLLAAVELHLLTPW